MATPPDLTPFGFTATESRVYATLLQLGPATGYAVARAARLARAKADLVRATLPAWRRAAERATLELRIAGDIPPEAASFALATVAETFPTVLLIDERQTVAITGAASERTGIWSSHPAVAAVARVALEALS